MAIHPEPPQRFGAGLTESEVRRFQDILREECGLEVGMPEAWSRAIALLSLVEMMLSRRGLIEQRDNPSEFAHPPS
jgi:hypothetical protein